jgi:carboxypeptidase Q
VRFPPCARRDRGFACTVSRPVQEFIVTRIRSALQAGAAMALVAVALGAQPPGPGAPAAAKAPLATPIHPDSLPAYVRRDAPTDPVIRRLWDEGMQRSQVARLGQVLLDSIGPRLTGSPNMNRAQDWAVALLTSWGVDAKKEAYGTWNAWERGPAFAVMTAPRLKPLDATTLSWSGHTNGAWEEGGVAILEPYETAEQFRAWLPSVKGKVVLVGAPRLSCRMPEQIAAFGTPEYIQSLTLEQNQLTAQYRGLNQRIPTFYQDVKDAGALAVFESNWSNYPGIQKIFGSPRNGAIPTFDIGCEDYGMLFRLARHNQAPTVRLMAESKSLGEQPVYNVIGTIPGSEKPEEYVVLSAHFDSWEGHSGATDNGTGSLTMLEALRLLRTAYPQPKRTIIIGLWSGEEQGLNGSRAFSEDRPEVVRGLQFLFNQDNGTGRVVSMSPNILPKSADTFARYLSQMPRELSQWMRLQGPGGIGGGTDHVSFACHGAPATTLNALSWDYSFTTWHTQRDSYDKLVIDDLKHNATITAMFAYLASEDPATTSRELLDPLPTGPGGQPITMPNCAPSTRTSTRSNR